MENPFVFGRIASGKSFTDREEEQERLAGDFRSGINSILISPRRWGKSSLVARVVHTVGKQDRKTRFCLLDLFNVRTEQEFYTQLATQLLHATSSGWEERVESAKKFLKSVSPKVSLGIDPQNDLSVSFDWNEVRKSPGEVLDLPERLAADKKLHLVVGLDEFQNIAFFDDPLAFQKGLRAHWQHHQHASYCLYGSKRHLMSEIFESTSMPLFKFGDVVFLEKIPDAYWVPFIMDAFVRTGKQIAESAAARIPRLMENHPYFVQQLAHAAWRSTTRSCREQDVEAAAEQLLVEQALVFQRQMDGLTNTQIRFLKALCDGVEHLSAAETIAAYRLGSSANVAKSRSALVHKEIVDVTPTTIEFLDPLFKLWVARVYMKH